MEKETIRTLCLWLSRRHDIPIDRIRIGSNQKTKMGSVTAYSEFGGTEYNKLTLSISTYNTSGDSEYWNRRTKISILSTIVHEFSHLKLFDANIDAGHGRAFVRTFHELLVNDWKELVAMYNLLACDNLSDDWEIFAELSGDRYFDLKILEKMLAERGADENSINYLSLVTQIVSGNKGWVSAITRIQQYGMGFSLGDRVIIVNYGDTEIAKLAFDESKTKLVLA